MGLSDVHRTDEDGGFVVDVERDAASLVAVHACAFLLGGYRGCVLQEGGLVG